MSTGVIEEYLEALVFSPSEKKSIAEAIRESNRGYSGYYDENK